MTGSSWTRAVRWPLLSWRNLAVTAVIALALLAVMGRLTNGASAVGTATSRPIASVTTTATAPLVQPPTTTAPESATPAATPSPAAPSKATATSPVEVAAAFVTAWAATAGGEAQWLAGMKPWATTELVQSFTGADPAQVPATRVTGDAALVSTKGATAAVTVPTDGGRVVVELVKTGSAWHAKGLAPDDAPPGAPTPSLGPAPTTTGS